MKRIAVAVFFLLFLVCPARAGDFAAGIILGYNVLTADAGDVSDDGVCVGVYGDYFIDPAIAIEGTVLYSQHDDVVDNDGSHEIKVLSFLLGPKFMFPGQKMAPYLSFGPSFYSLGYEFDPEGGPGTPRDENDTEAGLFASAGIQFPVKKNLSLGFNLSYHYVFNTDLLDGDIITSAVTVGF